MSCLTSFVMLLFSITPNASIGPLALSKSLDDDDRGVSAGGGTSSDVSETRASPNVGFSAVVSVGDANIDSTSAAERTVVFFERKRFTLDCFNSSGRFVPFDSVETTEICFADTEPWVDSVEVDFVSVCFVSNEPTSPLTSPRDTCFEAVRACFGVVRGLPLMTSAHDKFLDTRVAILVGPF